MDETGLRPDPSEDEIRSSFELLVRSDLPTKAIDVLRILAEGSKHSEDVRKRLASPEILPILVKQIEKDTSDSHQSIAPVLRCIGNACADNDAGRGIITGIGFEWASLCLGSEKLDDQTKMIASKALYNICADYEPAHEVCYRDKAHHGLLRFCDSTYARESEDVSLIIDLILWICGQKPKTEPELKENLAHDLLALLIEMPNIYSSHTDVEAFASCVETLLVYLRDGRIQRQVIEDDRLLNCWGVIESIQSRISLLNSDDRDDEEDLKLLDPLSASLTWCLSDIAATPEFATMYTIDSEPIKILIQYINTVGTASKAGSNAKTGNILLAAACQIVGNLLWVSPPEQYTRLVETIHLQSACFDHIVRSPSNTHSQELLHGLTGLLIQLTRPSKFIRELIAMDDNCQPALQKLSEHELPLIKQDCVKLIKVLCKESPANQERFGQLAKSLLMQLKDTSEAPS